MKITTIILISLAFISCCCGQTTKKQAETTNNIEQQEVLFRQIVMQDSGYLQKKEALYLLSMAKIVDSTDEYYEENEKYIKENDTIAKYYKMANGNYIFLIEYYFGGRGNSNIIIEFSPQGEVVKKDIYSESCCGYSMPLGYFNKWGDFFSLEVCECAMGGVGSCDLFFFKEVTSHDSLNRIPLDCWCSACGDILDDDKYTIPLCSGTVKKIEKDSLIISYESRVEIFSFIGEGSELLETINKKYFDILYIYKDNQWRIANKEDYENLNNTCFDMNV